MKAMEFLLRLRARPAVRQAERVLRGIGPLDRVAKRAYARHKREALEWATRDRAVRRAMVADGRLPDGFGEGMDERIVEYPWVLARIPPDATRLLDAGSTLNYAWVADHPALAGKEVVVFTLSPEGVLGRRNFSYLYGDLRSTLLRDGCMDAAVCLSTLEHVGMDNESYTGSTRDTAHEPRAYRAALIELRRVLRPGGPLLLTVPFGRARDLGWLQQFDARGLDDIIDTFGGTTADVRYFRHRSGSGWQVASAEECADAEFIYRTRAAHSIETRATAVACLDLRAPGP